MKKQVCELVFILDKSGSMYGLEADTIGGFNAMIAKQKTEAGDAFVTTVLFNTDRQIVHDRVSLGDVKEMTRNDYNVCGCTALLDAIGETIRHISMIHRYARKDDVPAKTMFVIITDGMENASRHFDVKKVKKMIEDRREKYGWEFLFLGANIDALETAASFGISEDCAANYHCDAKGTALNYHALSDAISSVRGGKGVGRTWKKAIDKDFKERK